MDFMYDFIIKDYEKKCLDIYPNDNLKEDNKMNKNDQAHVRHVVQDVLNDLRVDDDVADGVGRGGGVDLIRVIRDAKKEKSWGNFLKYEWSWTL